MARKKRPPKKKSDKPDKISAEGLIKKQFSGLQRLGWLMFILALGTNIAIFYFVIADGRDTSEWLLGAVVSTGLIFFFGIILLTAISSRGSRLRKLTDKAIEDEVGALRASTKRAESLQDMAATMRSTLNLQKVVAASLDVCAAALEEMGIPETSMVTGVFLYDDDEALSPVAERRLGNGDGIYGQEGAVAEALKYGEPVTIQDPSKDPELYEYPGIRKCKTAVIIPLRVAFQIYGFMLIATEVRVDFDKEQLETFTSVGDQAVIALRNAQLYENLEQEKQRLLQAETEARNQLARDLHDGPTQSVAAIAMRINFVRTLLKNDLDEAMSELEKVEDLAKATGHEIRGMLFTLRPLVLETQGLGAAIETVMERIRESDGIDMRMAGSEYGELLNPRAQGVIFYMVEEALGNAKKHSRASIVEVRFWQEGNLFVARIQDNGVGFDVDEVMDDYSSRGSLGMINLQERAESIDGSTKVESQSGKGTSITIIVPLDKQGVDKK